MTAPPEETFVRTSNHRTLFMQTSSLAIGGLKRCSDFVLSPSSLRLLRTLRLILCLLRYIFGCFYGTEHKRGTYLGLHGFGYHVRYGSRLDGWRGVCIYLLISTVSSVLRDIYAAFNTGVPRSPHWMHPYLPLIVEILTGLDIVACSAVMFFYPHLRLEALATYRTGPKFGPTVDYQINGIILPFLMLLSGLIAYHVFIKIEERKWRYRIYRNEVQPIVLFTESGDPVACFPRVGENIQMLSVDSLIQPQHPE